MHRVLRGDCREVMASLPDASVHCCVTSPPYFGLRDYGFTGQIGLEPTPAEYVDQIVAVFRGVRRVLRDDGTLWLNLGDSYAANRSYQVPSTLMNGDATNQAQAAAGQGMRAADFGLKAKDLIGIPWRVAFALQADGWYLRQDIIWSKPNPMPESVTDRCTKAHEYVFLMSKSPRYYFDAKAIAEPAIYAGGTGCVSGGKTAARAVSRGGRPTGNEAPGAGRIPVGDTRNKRSVWTITTRPFRMAHFATMPPALADICIRAGCPPGGVVLDPFGGAGTTGLAAALTGRSSVLIEMNHEYADMAEARIGAACVQPSLFSSEAVA